jgi:hypothetical protein
MTSRCMRAEKAIACQTRRPPCFENSDRTYRDVNKDSVVLTVERELHIDFGNDLDPIVQCNWVDVAYFSFRSNESAKRQRPKSTAGKV